jgi:prepilin-type N-terminal cleavage/methylation domain-containing protein
MKASQPKSTHGARATGFSLVELLSVLAIIGVLSGLILPHIADANEAAKNSVARRNAQNLASIFTCGQVAGVNWEADSVETAVANVFAGKTAGDGAFAGKIFKVATIPASDLPNAIRYLRWDSESSTLFYVQTSTP